MRGSFLPSSSRVVSDIFPSQQWTNNGRIESVWMICLLSTLSDGYRQNFWKKISRCCHAALLFLWRGSGESPLCARHAYKKSNRCVYILLTWSSKRFPLLVLMRLRFIRTVSSTSIWKWLADHESSLLSMRRLISLALLILGERWRMTLQNTKTRLEFQSCFWIPSNSSARVFMNRLLIRPFGTWSCCVGSLTICFQRCCQDLLSLIPPFKCVPSS